MLQSQDETSWFHTEVELHISGSYLLCKQKAKTPAPLASQREWLLLPGCAAAERSFGCSGRLASAPTALTHLTRQLQVGWIAVCWQMFSQHKQSLIYQELRWFQPPTAPSAAAAVRPGTAWAGDGQVKQAPALKQRAHVQTVWKYCVNIENVALSNPKPHLPLQCLRTPMFVWKWHVNQQTHQAASRVVVKNSVFLLLNLLGSSLFLLAPTSSWAVSASSARGFLEELLRVLPLALVGTRVALNSHQAKQNCIKRTLKSFL